MASSSRELGRAGRAAEAGAKMGVRTAKGAGLYAGAVRMDFRLIRVVAGCWLRCWLAVGGKRHPRSSQGWRSLSPCSHVGVHDVRLRMAQLGQRRHLEDIASGHKYLSIRCKNHTTIYQWPSFLFRARVLRDVLTKIAFEVGALFKTGVGLKSKDNFVQLW
jgi:hypothetical protein